MNKPAISRHSPGGKLPQFFTAVGICVLFLFIQNLIVPSAYGDADSPSTKNIPASLSVQNRAVLVTINRIVRKPVVVKIIATGRLQEEVSNLYFKIPGSMESICVEEGDKVLPGQILAELDKKDFINKLNLEKVQLERIREQHKLKLLLYKAKIISSEAYEDFLESVKISEINYDMAKLQLSYCTITAPSKGIVLRKFFDYPTAVKAGTPIFLFKSADDPWVVSLRVSDKNAHMIKPGDDAHVSFPIYPKETFKGRVFSVSRSADPTDGLFNVKVILDDSSREFLSGMFARAQITHSESIELFHVPVAGLLEMRGSHGKVFVLSPNSNRAKMMNVSVHSIIGTEAALETDLKGFDRVIIGGKQNVFDGVHVEIIPEARN